MGSVQLFRPPVCKVRVATREKVKRAIAEAMALGNGGCEDREVREAAERSTRDPSTLSDVDDLDGMFALDD